MFLFLLLLGFFLFISFIHISCNKRDQPKTTILVLLRVLILIQIPLNTTINYHQLSPTITNHPQLSSTIINYYWPARVSYHELSSCYHYYQQLSLTNIVYHFLCNVALLNFFNTIYGLIKSFFLFRALIEFECSRRSRQIQFV